MAGGGLDEGFDDFAAEFAFVTVDRSQAAHLWPARHHAGQAGASLPPMGLRLRLRAGVDIGGFPARPG